MLCIVVGGYLFVLCRCTKVQKLFKKKEMNRILLGRNCRRKSVRFVCVYPLLIPLSLWMKEFVASFKTFSFAISLFYSYFELLHNLESYFFQI